MNSKELLFKALRNEEAERIPWVSFAGCHAANIPSVGPMFLKQQDAGEYENLHDSDMLEMIKHFMNSAKNDIIKQNGEIAHFKTCSISSGGYMKLRLTANDDEIGITQDNTYNARNNSSVTNARVRLQPEGPEKIIHERLHASCEKFGMRYTDYSVDSFKPGRPCECARTKECN
ncbi:MAG: hypothetical protein ACOYJC_11340 [Christensenellales bacterium]|jgi:hypothetical protein